MALTLATGVQELPGIGAANAKKLDKLGLATVGDLLAYLPRDYEDRTGHTTIRDALPEHPACITAFVAEQPRLSRIRKGLELVRVKVVDETAAMVVTFFNQSYVRQALRVGESYVFYGRVEGTGRTREMTNPVFEREDAQRFTGCIMPVYPLTAGISNNRLAGLTRRCAQECAGQLPEPFGESMRGRYGLCDTAFAHRMIHVPESWEALERAKHRLVFEELFCLTCGMQRLRERRREETGARFTQGDPERFWESLPFTPTDAQRRAVREAAEDLTSGRPMNRLLQGDVGSGKTAVAAACAYLARESGWQTAMMAPTEILAEQHMRTLTDLLAPTGVRVGLLTGGMGAARRREVLAALAAGEIDLLVGTHALLTQDVDFARLGLVITDEQHRFGVEQRAALAGKAGMAPHVLVMSATPIPRTLALIIYGDLDVSVLDELPPGRTPVQTYLVREDKRERLYGFVRRLVGEGRQVYIICPAVEEQEESAEEGFADLKAVTAYAEELRTQVFPELSVAFVHGRMKSREKESVMASFTRGEIDVLVSTTVIEVGVDVPNAALMIVENADRFGLSQLHQLRGRVGRGTFQSYCVLVSNTRREESLRRLRVMTATNDGFRIAEEDLKLRGPGDFFGQRQHGLPEVRIADLSEDLAVMNEARAAAQELLREDPELEKPENRALRERIGALFTENPNMFN